MDDAVVTVSTVKADPDQIERFVRRNRDAGVDHLLVFLDEANPPVRQMLEADPNVTVVRTGPKYWNGKRPQRVSDRLRINMNVANAVLATVPSVAWLVSIDSDEVLSLDLEELRRNELRAVRLAVLEAVSRRSWPDDEPALFKRVPTEGELAVLAALGSISEPDPAFYFRGHQEGKPAIRPDLSVRLKVHSAVDQSGRGIARYVPGMHVLHYESHSLDDFVRRWKDYRPESAHLRTHRDERKQLGIALHTLYGHPALDDADRDRLIGELFDRQVADDLATLQALDLVVPAPKRSGQPRGLPATDVDQIRVVLDALMPADKDVFNDGGTTEQIARELEAAHARLDRDADRAAGNVRRTLDSLDYQEPAPTHAIQE